MVVKAPQSFTLRSFRLKYTLKIAMYKIIFVFDSVLFAHILPFTTSILSLHCTWTAKENKLLKLSVIVIGSLICELRYTKDCI